MTTPERDEARAALVAYHRALITHQPLQAYEIECRYGFDGLPPKHVSVGLQAISEGRDPWDAIEQPMEKSE